MINQNKSAKWLLGCLTCVVILASVIPVRASSVIPPKDFGELVRMSDIVVVARASTSNSYWLSGLIMTNTRFEVLEVIKGSLQIGEPFDVSVHGGFLGDRGFAIGGSPIYKEGDVYLLSLSKFNSMWMSRHMAYGQLIQKQTVSGDRIFTHLEESHNLNIVLPDGRSAEPITSYKSETLVKHLKGIVGGLDVWNSDVAGELEYDSHDGSIQPNSIMGIDAAPPGCVYFEDSGFKLRWKRFDDSLPVTVKVQTGAPSNVVSAVQNAVATWKGIAGVNMATLVYGGNNPVATCIANSVDTSPIPYWEAHIFIDDPCSQITDLVSCSGTLAIAGPSYTNVQHAQSGENWYTNVVGFMVVNNGTPGCLNQTKYDQTINHELGHILGFGHHTGATANMNANCCSPITSLDESCALYAYGTGVPNPIPTITSLTPDNATQGTSNLPVTIAGTNFMASSTLGVTGGGGISINSANFVNATQINLNISISAGAALGLRNFTLTNIPPGGGVSNIATFTVLAQPNPVPSLTSITPNSAEQGSATPVMLTGTGFAAGATIQVSGSGVTATSVNVVNATTITATFTIGGAATLGARNVTVTNPAPGGGVSNAVAFTVTQALNPLPVLTSISPSTGIQGAVVNVILSGTGFVNGSLVQVSGSGVTVSNIVVSKVTVINSTSIQAEFAIANNASPGARSVTVTNPAPGGGVSGSQTFTVSELFVNKAPTLDPIPDISFLHTADVQQVQLSGISAGIGENQSITIDALALNPQLLPLLYVTYTSAQPTGQLTLQNSRTRVGTTSVKVIVRDNAGTANGGVDSLIRVFSVNVMLDTDIESDADEVPHAYALHANYPNPFNPSTVIPFTLPERTHVRLSVFDITGRERAVLVNKEYAAGIHQVTLDASELSSGVYLVRLQSALGIQSITIMLLK